MLQLRRRNIPLFAILFAVRAVSSTVLRSSWDCASLANPQFGGLLFRLPARRGWHPLEFRLVRAGYHQTVSSSVSSRNICECELIVQK